MILYPQKQYYKINIYWTVREHIKCWSTVGNNTHECKEREYIWSILGQFKQDWDGPTTTLLLHLGALFLNSSLADLSSFTHKDFARMVYTGAILLRLCTVKSLHVYHFINLSHWNINYCTVRKWNEGNKLCVLLFVFPSFLKLKKLV